MPTNYLTEKNMTLLLSCQGISKSYGSRLLFKELSFGLFKGDKIGLIGPNGSGKSTFLKIIADLDKPDVGNIARSKSLRVGYIPQETVFPGREIIDIVSEAMQVHHHYSPEEQETQAIITLSKLGFEDFTVLATSLSGGWKKRLALAVELVKEPDILLLDEPTNHLDLEGVIWLEKFLKTAPFSYIVISHDRYFLEHITTRMMEMNKSYPKGLFVADGSYSLFLEKRGEFLSGQVQQEKSLASKVRREVEWLKQNPKARTTKSVSRIQEANRLIQELDGLKDRNKESQSVIDFSSSKRDTQKLVVATNLSMSMGGRNLFSGINLLLAPGTRLGIVGLNGSGKTTLLRLLAGELKPEKGTIKYAEGISIVYFDQHRAQLPPNTTLRRALAPENDMVTYRGQSIHVNSWCKRFLFTPDKLELPFEHLSGGEKARVHIARLMLKPADILLLDEPTNDLDIPTLELLEESLLDFPGAIVLISHDRYLLDQVSNIILGLGKGSETTLFADYRQWEQHQPDLPEEIKTEKSKAVAPAEIKPKKMTYSEKRELEQIEAKIPEIEQAIRDLEKQTEDLENISQPAKLQKLCQELEGKHRTLEDLYSRWHDLETKK
jgi:ABC transport system ATP-binding/permease protein